MATRPSHQRALATHADLFHRHRHHGHLRPSAAQLAEPCHARRPPCFRGVVPTAPCAGTSPPPPPDQIVAAPTLLSSYLPPSILNRLPASVADRARRDGSPGDRPLYGIGPGCIFSPDFAALCKQFPLAIDFDSQGLNSDTTQSHGSAPLVATMAGDIPCGRPSIPAACTGSDIPPPSPRLDAPSAAASADSATAAVSRASSGDLASDAHRAFKERVMPSTPSTAGSMPALLSAVSDTTDVLSSPAPPRLRLCSSRTCQRICLLYKTRSPVNVAAHNELMVRLLTCSRSLTSS
eukprot:jgi/Ulvmu1/4294/UM002_0014.1